MKTVGVYRTVFPLPSETFIDQQVRSLRTFQPLMLNRSALGPTDLPQLALNKLRWGTLREGMYAGTGSPLLFGSRLKAERLSLIHAHFGQDAVYALRLARHLSVPLVVTFHGADCTSSRYTLLRSGRISDWRYLVYEAGLRSKADRFIAVSHYIHAVLLERGYSKDKLIQHYIGVDTTKFQPKLRDEEVSQRYILNVGRHTEKKGIDTLLRAFARLSKKHPDVDLVQVGGGELTARLKRLARSLGIERRVQFAGVKGSDEVRHLMRRSTLFSLPSQTAASGDSEALGIVFNEASACGIPIVSTWHGGIPEAVLHGETGLLVSERDDRALADAIDIILSDPGLGKQFGHRGREFVCDVFELSKQTLKLEAIYEGLLC